MIRPEALLLAFAVAPAAMMNFVGLICLLFFFFIIFAFFAASVGTWLEFPVQTATYLILSSGVYVALKVTLAARAKKIISSGGGEEISFATILLSIPMFISLAVATYLWCVGFISLIYSNFYILLSVGGTAVSFFLLWDFLRPWISSSKSKKLESDDP